MGLVGAAVEQAGVQLLGDQRVLEPLGQPVQHGRDQLGVHVVPDLVPPDPELHEVQGAVGVLGEQEPVDVALQLEVGAVVPDEGHPIRDPVLSDETARL